MKIVKKERYVLVQHHELTYKLPREVFYTLHIDETTEVNQNMLQRLDYESNLYQAKEKSLRALKSPKTTFEIKTLLVNFPNQVIIDVISFLKHYHYLDDLAYMKWYHLSKPQHGKTRLSFVFKQKGIQFDQIHDYLETIDEQIMIETVAVSLLKSVKNMSYQETKQKVYQKLLRLGFNSSLSLSTIESLHIPKDLDESLLDQLFNKKHSKLKGNAYEKCQMFIKMAVSKGFDYHLAKKKCEEIHD